MDFFEVVAKRCDTVRDFEDRDVEEEKINQILDMTNKAPSAGNLQAYEIFLVRDPQRRSSVAKAAHQDFIAKAPVVLVFFAHPARIAEEYGARGEDLYCIQDATIATAHAQLASAALGLNARWVGGFDDDSIRQVLGVGRELRPVAVLPIGYWGTRPEPKPRRVQSELVHRL